MKACTLMIAALVYAIPAAGQSASTVRFRAVVEHANGKTGDNSGVVVWLTPQPAPGPAPTPGHFRLLQKNKAFEPHLLVIPVGSVVDFPNQDPFFHNVFSLYKGKRFDLGLYEAGSSKSVHFDRVGVSFIFCNIHPDMSAVVLTMSTPYYAVSNPAGDMALRDVPDGRYRLQIWYERASADSLEHLARDLVVDGAVSLPIRVSEAVGSVPHKNKYGNNYEKTPEYGPR